MMKPIPYGKQHITSEDIDAVVDVLKSDFLTQGPKIAEFEKAFADYIGSKYAIAVSNGTAALHLSAIALGVEPGDKVITTPITFAASANCVRYAGGEVVFADINPETYLLDIGEVEKLLKESPAGTYKGIIPVDFAGRAVDLEAFRKLADEHDCWLLEDACHAPGGYFIDSKGEKQQCGNGNYADLAIFSFHPVKHIAAGEGGMITTNDEKLYQKLLTLRTHGVTKDNSLFRNSVHTALGQYPKYETLNPEHETRNNKQFTSLQAGEQQTPNNEHRTPNTELSLAKSRSAGQQTQYPGWYYEMQDLGYNYRLTDFQAALGLSQLKRADEGLARRCEIASVYDNAFAGKSFIKGQSGVIDGHGYHLYIIEVENRKGLYDYLRENKIFAQIHYIPVHLMPYYNKLGWKEGDMPNAEKYYKNCLSLPMYPSLTKKEQRFVVRTIFSYFNINI